MKKRQNIQPALMNDFNRKEIKITYNFINKFLRQFEDTPTEEDFWEEIYDISGLKIIREKLKLILEKHA